MKPMPLDDRIAICERLLSGRERSLARDPDNEQLQKEVHGYREVHARLMRLREKEQDRETD